MYVSPSVFDREFSRFKTLVRDNSNGQEFISFHEGLPVEWEGYKENVRNEALDRLQMAMWKSGDIGSGNILKRVIEAIEINENPQDLRNNLVSWQNRYGHAGRSHNKLLDAQANPQAMERFEQWFFDYAQDARPPKELFESFRELAGKRYDLLAYLFFLKDWTRFMPIAPRYFDELFRILEVSLTTRKRCSWENYEEFNDTLTSVQRHLIERAGISDTRLVDAHSFCWMRVRLLDD